MAITTNIITAEPKYVFLFTSHDIIVHRETQELPNFQTFLTIQKENGIDFFIEETNYQYIAAFLKTNFEIPQDYDTITHRSVFAINLEYASISARARSLLNWKINTLFCSKCGKLLIDCIDESACECTQCKKRYYPQNSPAIIVQIYKENKLLLANHVKHRDSLYTCIAGFLEPGETIEECVVREAKEEVSITVDNVKYIESQSWPFPHQLMIGCTAEWVCGEIKVEENELRDAQWFLPNELPEIPTEGTLARRLIRPRS